MGLWLLTLALIVVVVALGVVASRRQPISERSLVSQIGLRVLGIVVVTAAVAVAKINVGPVAAAATGVVGVAAMVWILLATGFARLSLPRR